MKNILISLVVGVALVGGVGFIAFSQKKAADAVPATTTPEVSGEVETELPASATPPPAKTSTTTPPVTTPPAPTTPVGITSAEVATHNSRSSCWATINGNVYDLTSWIPNHPGGEKAILQLCGTDGSAKFNKQHGSFKQAITVLSGFKIGIAAK